MEHLQVAVVWGDVATWFSGVVGAAVVVVSVLALRSAAESARQSSYLVRIERERFEDERRERRRNQALRVNARLVWREIRPGEGRRVEHQFLVVSNASHERVTDVVITVAAPEPTEMPRPLRWAVDDLDVITVPMRVQLSELEPDALTGPTEVRVEVSLSGSLVSTDPPGDRIKVRWLPRPAPFAVRAPVGLEDPTHRPNDELDLFRAHEREPRPLNDPRPPEGPQRDRARYEYVVDLLNQDGWREGARATGGGKHWSVEFTDAQGVRWLRTPERLVEQQPKI